MDDDDSHQLAKANLSVDDIVQKEVTNTETNKFVCIEELSNERVANAEGFTPHGSEATDATLGCARQCRVT